jgi:Uma2 family endonuclease
VVEILSRDDRHAETMERISDCLSFGVPYVWVIDPLATRRIHLYAGWRPGHQRRDAAD